MADKLKFAQECQKVATSLADAVSTGRNLVDAYFDRVYNTGGTAIVDGDVSTLGITAANISSTITLLQQLANFNDNAAVTQADYGATLSKMRTDL